jgi:hypothetical protein
MDNFQESMDETRCGMDRDGPTMPRPIMPAARERPAVVLSYVGRETRCADEAVLATSPINPVRLQRVAADLGEPA